MQAQSTDPKRSATGGSNDQAGAGDISIIGPTSWIHEADDMVSSWTGRAHLDAIAAFGDWNA
jgi:hypothetical protein